MGVGGVQSRLHGELVVSSNCTKRSEVNTIKVTNTTYHRPTKSHASSEKPSGRVGGSPWTMAVSCAKTFAYVSGGYGYVPMATSTIDRPRDQTSEETLYVPKLFTDSPWMRSGWKERHQSARRDNFMGERLTAMYDWQPMFVFAKLFSSWPETPKSQSLITPWRLTSTLVGLTSLFGYAVSISSGLGEFGLTSMHNL